MQEGANLRSQNPIQNVPSGRYTGEPPFVAFLLSVTAPHAGGSYALVTPRSLTLTIDGVPVTRTVTTLPYTNDSDGDGLKDDEEWYGTSVNGVVTDPSDPDTDDDGLADGQERYMKEVAMPTRATVGASVSVPLSVRIAGPVEKVTVSYGLSTIDVSNFALTLYQGSNRVVLRNHQGSGLFNFSSTDLPSSMRGGGTYTLDASSWASGGILEKFSLLFTIRTSPIKADTDGDGLNDSEEVTAGSDGWITDPQLADTDGDGWNDAYEIARGTSPVSADTDADGALDNVDLDPLHNLVVAVTVDRIHHGGAWWDPELVGVVRVNDDVTWVTEHRLGSDDHTASFFMTYTADVPDNVATANLRITAWSVNDLRGDDVLVDVSFPYAVGSDGFASTVHVGDSWMSYEVSTVRLEKAPTFLVTDGQATVTSAAGVTRMASQDRVFVLSLDVTSASWPFDVGVTTVLVPRSVFLDSKLKADVDAGVFDPLPNADVYGDDLSAAVLSDGVAAVIAGTLTGAQAWSVLNRLLLNASGGAAHTYGDVTDEAVVANLPADVVKILPWQAVFGGPTGDMPQDFWSKIGAVATTVVNALVYVGQMIYEGLVALGTFLVNLAQAIGDWGMKALGAVVDAAVSVAQKVGEGLGRLADWVVNFVVSTITTAIAQMLNGIKALLDGTIGQFVRELESALSTVDPNDLANKLASLAQVTLTIAVALALLPVAIRAASVAIKAVTAGFSWLVETAISEGVAEFIVRVLMGIAFSLATTALFTAILDTMGWVEDTTAGFFKTVGVMAATIAAVSKVAFKLYESVFLKTATDIPIVQRYKGFALAVFGLSLVLIGSTAYAQAGLGRLVVDFAGFAFQAFGFWLYMRNRNDPLVQIGDFVAPMGSAIEHGITVLSPPVGAAKISLTFAQGGYG